MKVLYISHDNQKGSGWGQYTKSTLDEVKARNIPHSYFGLKNILSKRGLNRLIGLPLSLLKVRKEASNSEIVHVFDVWPFAIWGYFAVLGTKKKLFFTAIGSYSIPPKKLSIKRFLMAAALKRAKKVFAISNYTRKRLLESISLDNVITVHMGTPKVADQINNIEARHLLQIRDEAQPVILTVGQIKHRKGQLDTLKAISILKNDFPNILYLIVGDDSDKEYLSLIDSEIVKNDMVSNVRVLSNLSDSKSLAAAYSAADIFCLNSNNDGDNFEGFGLVILEAALFGKPVIGSRDCGIEDAIEDQYNGYLSDQGNSMDIASKIKMILKRSDMEGFSKEFANRFTWGNMVRTYLNEYK